VLGNTISANLTYYVDNTPPHSYASPANKSIVGLSDKIVLKAKDPGGEECASDKSVIYYHIFSTQTGEWSGWNASGSGTSVEITFTENCTHYIEFYAKDSAGNIEAINNYTYYVDDTPPTTAIGIGNPNVTKSSNTYYVTSHTKIWLNSSDTGCNGGAGVKELHYIITYNGQPHRFVIQDNQSGDSDSTPGVISVNFTFNEQCNHTLEYWSIDNVGNEEEHHIIYFLVDNSPPEINRTIKLPKYEKDGKLYITSNTPIWVNATDTGATEECTVGSVHINVSVDGSSHYTAYAPQGWASIVPPIQISGEGMHWINITAWDDLNNTAYHNETLYVDNTPPSLQKARRHRLPFRRLRILIKINGIMIRRRNLHGQHHQMHRA